MCLGRQGAWVFDGSGDEILGHNLLTPLKLYDKFRRMKTGWIPIQGFEHFYELLLVEDHRAGAVRSLDKVIRCNTGYRLLPGRVLRPYPDKDGYPFVRLTDPDGEKHNIRVSRLVCQAAHGSPPEEGMEAAHLNNIKTDNRPSNLEWKTHLDNVQQALKDGLRNPPHGEQCSWSKLNEVAVRVIRWFSGKRSQRDVGRAYGIKQAYVSRIQSGERWVSP
jgi:HNH endonuclease